MRAACGVGFCYRRSSALLRASTALERSHPVSEKWCIYTAIPHSATGIVLAECEACMADKSSTRIRSIDFYCVPRRLFAWPALGRAFDAESSCFMLSMCAIDAFNRISLAHRFITPSRTNASAHRLMGAASRHPSRPARNSRNWTWCRMPLQMNQYDHPAVQRTYVGVALI